MKTPTRLWHHDLPHIKHALEIARRLAFAHGTPKDTQHIDYAIKRLDRWHVPSGITVDGREVPVESMFSDRDRSEMDRLARHD